VPTVYHTRLGVVLETSQYSVGEYAMPLRGPNGNGNGNGNHHPQPGHPSVKDKDGNVHKLAQGSGVGPAGSGAAGDTHPTSMVQNAFVDLSYDLSPIMNVINASPGSLLHFLVRLCAVVGGVLSVTRMTDKIVNALLVGTGVVSVPRMSGGGGFVKASSRGYSSNPGSARNSLPGDATAYVSGPGSIGGALPYVPSRSSYGGGVSSPMHSLNSYPVRTSSSGGGMLAGQSSGQFPATGVQPQDPAGLHQRATPGSHPLSRMTSSGSSAISGGGVQHGQLSNGGAGPGTPVAPGSFGGGAPLVSYSSGNFGGSIGSGAGGVVVGDAIPLAGLHSGAGSGQVSHLLAGAAGNSLAGGMGGAGGVGGSRPYSSSGGGAPLQQPAAGYGASRLGPPGQYAAR
jgi:hypothetical protein